MFTIFSHFLTKEQKAQGDFQLRSHWYGWLRLRFFKLYRNWWWILVLGYVSSQRLLEYKAMIVKLGKCACVVRPNVTLWKNDGFLQLFCNFSKSNAFGENFIRTKFILHKIFFRINIRSSRKSSWMFVNLCWKNCEKSFVGGRDNFEGKGVSGYKN